MQERINCFFCPKCSCRVSFLSQWRKIHHIERFLYSYIHFIAFFSLFHNHFTSAACRSHRPNKTPLPNNSLPCIYSTVTNKRRNDLWPRWVSYLESSLVAGDKKQSFTRPSVSVCFLYDADISCNITQMYRDRESGQSHTSDYYDEVWVKTLLHLLLKSISVN